MVKSDHVVETHHFRRVIRLKKGLVLETKKYDDPTGKGRRISFNVDTITLFWEDGKDVEYIMAYGTSVKDKKLNCRRRYEPGKVPPEVQEIIDGTL